MLKRLKTVSMMLFLMGASTGAAYAASLVGVDDVKITQQSGTCTGVVLDSMGETVIGASVIVKGTTNGTITDFDGNFSLSGVKKGDILVVSFVGYQTVEVKWEGQALTVTLSDDTQALEEVVVIGYGGVQKAKTMTASAATVKVGDLAKLPVTSMSEGLGGRVTGVITQQGSGAPGENAKIWVRGGDKILYVIDDVVMESDQGNEFFNRLRPDDIASMSVLKDAAATAVYGPRAANGVVVIATKRGQEGAPTITFNQKLSIQTPSYKMEAMSPYEFAQARNEIMLANYAETPSFNNEALARLYLGDMYKKGYSQSEMLANVNEKYNMGWTSQDILNLFDPMVSQGYNIQDYYTHNDQWDQFDTTNPMYQTNISLRGGSERIKYYSSLGYLSQQGFCENYDYEQINAILNTDAMLLKDKSLKFTLNLNGNTTMKKMPYEGNNLFNNTMYGNWYPNQPAVWSNGKKRAGSVASRLNKGFNNTEAYRFQMNAALKWNLPWIQGLSAQASVNFTYSQSNNRQFNHDEEGVYASPYAAAYNTYNPNNATLYDRYDKYKLLTGIVQLDYNKTFGKHSIGAMVNYQSQIRKTNWLRETMKGYATTLVPQINNGTTYVGHDGSATEWGSASYIGRLTYSYDDKYLLQYSANYNGSLSYSPEKRWGYFHAISLGWVMSDEEWFKNLINPNVVNMFKLRGGWGAVGSDEGIEPFSYLTQYAQNGTNILFGDNMANNTGWYMSSLANDLEWVSSTQWGAGVDFEMFKGKLAGTVDVFLYLNKGDKMSMTSDMLRTDILGMPNVPQINAPYVTKRKGGFEFSLNWNDKIGEVGYRVGVNYSFWDQRYTRHTSESSDWYSPTFDRIGKRWMVPVYKYAVKTDGYYRSWDDLYNSMAHANRGFAPGTPKTVDMNGDGRVNDYYVLNQGGQTPLTQYGITLGANYKGFDLELFFQGAANVSTYMASPLRCQQDWMWNYGQFGFANAYTPSNPDLDAPIPLPTAGSRAWGYSFIDSWIFDADYLKLKNISLRYDMKKYVLKNVDFIQGLDLSFVVTNAFTWTKKEYALKDLVDPEYMAGGDNIWNGGTLGSYPTQRSYTLGITLTL